MTGNVIQPNGAASSGGGISFTTLYTKTISTSEWSSDWAPSGYKQYIVMDPSNASEMLTADLLLIEIVNLSTADTQYINVSDVVPVKKLLADNQANYVNVALKVATSATSDLKGNFFPHLTLRNGYDRFQLFIPIESSLASTISMKVVISKINIG